MRRQRRTLPGARNGCRIHSVWIVVCLFLMLPALAAATEQSRFAGVVTESEWDFSDEILDTPDNLCASGLFDEAISVSDFGFNLPNNADIQAITVEVKSIKAFETDNEGAIVDLLFGNGGHTFNFYLTVPGSGGNSAGCSDSQLQPVSVGPLWGRTWTAAEINAASFGARIDANTGDGVLADSVRITVTYIAPPALFFDPTSLDFGDVVVGTTSAPMIATLHNTGDVDATELSFSGLPASGFEADTSDCGGTLPAGGSCEVQVTFVPQQPGPVAATLTVASAESVSAELALAGNGIKGTEVFSPVGLIADPWPFMNLSDGNSVFEPGERVVVSPVWRNDGELELYLHGTATDFTGPGGATYTLINDDGLYGEVMPGATGDCLDDEQCYEMEVLPDGAPRPVRHWDAFLDESLFLDETTTTWTLHLGDTFTDVPRDHLFYRSVETLVHNGATLGCGTAEYCPGGTASRGQMSVFVLRSLEGADYEPPPCEEGDERFDDVPAGNAFCPWIEDLAGRGVVQGCGGGNFCPADPVTRAQMSIFLLKTLEGADYSPPECAGLFTDVTCPSLFAAWIEDLAVRGVTDGCTATQYCPGEPTTRGQMTVFLTRAFGLSLYGPELEPPGPSDSPPVSNGDGR